MRAMTPEHGERREGQVTIDGAGDRRDHRHVRAGVAQRRLQLLQLGPQVLPRGLPGPAGDAQRVVDADRLPRERRRDGAGRARRRRRRGGLRQLHAVRCVRAALPEHPVHRRLLPLPHPYGGPRQGGARARRRSGHPPAGLPALEPADRRAPPRAGARRVAATRPQSRSTRTTSPSGRRTSTCPIGGETILFVDCEAAFYRTSVAASGRPDAPAGGGRVRPHARAVVLRRAGRGDGLRRAGDALRAPQPRRLARGRRQADDRARPARLHHVHRGLPAVLRRRRSTTWRSCWPSSYWPGSCATGR